MSVKAMYVCERVSVCVGERERMCERTTIISLVWHRVNTMREFFDRTVNFHKKHMHSCKAK